jgi:uncharacterized protein YndB with AHSA1/START domain
MSVLKLVREFSQDPQTVFTFVTQTENLLKWWGPEGMSVPEHNLDFTKTGSWSSVMVNKEGRRHMVTGKVTRVDPPNSVEFTWGWHDENDVRGHDSRVRFDLRANGSGGTEFTLTHFDLADDESAENHETGWTSSLRKLEQLAV